MSYQVEKSDTANYETFIECVSKIILERSEDSEPKRRRGRKGKAASSTGHASWAESHDPEDMAEFIEYIARETFDSLPEESRVLSYSAVQGDKSLAAKFEDPIPTTTLDALTSAVPLSVCDSMCAYGFLSEPSDFSKFLHGVTRDYISSVTAPPPPWSSTRASACEICGRDWINLSYHHLIPKSTHAKVLKRNWHQEWTLNSVAWICGACHRFVHRMASNEELAKSWYTVDRILQREDVQDWVHWASRLRWKAR